MSAMRKKLAAVALSIITATATLTAAGCGSTGNAKSSEAPIKSSEVAQSSSVVSETSAKESSVSSSTISTETAADATEPVKAGISVQKIDNLSPDFIDGVDVSSYLAEIKSGAKYYDFNGNEADLFDILKDAGVNYVRIRVWNCPYHTDDAGKIVFTDKNGTEYSEDDIVKSTSPDGYNVYSLEDGTEVYPEGYGAGNCDVDTAEFIGKKATDHGMKVLIDFHYSDFWADPNKQKAPKTWSDLDAAGKGEAAAKFTTDALTQLKNAGVNVTMVQIGNETNNGVAGLRYITDVYPFFKTCAEAVRSFDKNILIAVHYTDPQKYGYQSGVADKLDEEGVDYDVFATSYYPFWHGTTDDLTKDLSLIIKKHNKKVMVAETSYPWTMDDGDGYGNNVNPGATDQTYNYPVSVEGQAQSVRDVMAAVASCGENALGVFYWEPAWIPVKSENWNLYGSGWASKYAKEFDPEVHDENNGATWDNQAYFDFTGKALESLKVYQYVKTGSVAPVSVSKIEDSAVEMNYHSEPELPEKVTVDLSDGNTVEAPVVWDKDQVAALSTADFGDQTITGEVQDFSYDSIDGTVSVKSGEYTANCSVTIKGEDLVKNGSFEDGSGNGEGWDLKNNDKKGGGAPKIDRDEANAHSGEFYYTGWDEKAIDFTISEKLEADKLTEGTYTLTAYYQGTKVDNVDDASKLFLKVTYKDGTKDEFKADIKINNTWKDFYKAEVKDIKLKSDVKSATVGTRLKVDGAEGPWVVVDDISLMKAE